MKELTDFVYKVYVTLASQIKCTQMFSNFNRYNSWGWVCVCGGALMAVFYT